MWEGTSSATAAVAFDSAIGNQIIFIGDSKTVASNPNVWPVNLTAALNTATNPSTVWGGDNVGVGATTTQYWHDNIDTVIAGQIHNHVLAVINLGVNDGTTLPAEATWEANTEYYLDALHAAYPAIQCYLMRPWKQGFDANAATLHSWIDTVVAARSTFVHTGPDEAVWLKGSDNGASETMDGVHYSSLGETLCAAQWQSTLGY